MIVSVRRAKGGKGLTLKVGPEESGSTAYDQTIHPGESALGFTYEEWDVAVGPQPEGILEVAEDGSLRPGPDEFEAPADGHA